MIPQAYVALNNTKVGANLLVSRHAVDHQGKIATVSFMDNRGLGWNLRRRSFSGSFKDDRLRSDAKVKKKKRQDQGGGWTCQ